jgi:hypothetical protein
MKDLMIDGPASVFPIFGETKDQVKAIKALYLKTFGKKPPENADYSDIKLAVEFGDPIKPSNS